MQLTGPIAPHPIARAQHSFAMLDEYDDHDDDHGEDDARCPVSRCPIGLPQFNHSSSGHTSSSSYAVHVYLEKPLGDRAVIDAQSGEVLPLHVSKWG